jgi:hypothetical protein
MQPLVQLSDLNKIKYIADSVKNSAIWPMVVSEAQEFDIKSWLGDALLNELITQSLTSPESISTVNEILLEGGSYIYQSETYLFQGLKSCIIYFAFGRFTSKAPYNYTQAGITVKDTDLSTPASDKAVQRLATEAMLTACAIRDEIIKYLRRKSSDYPLFKTGSKSFRPRTFLILGD